MLKCRGCGNILEQGSFICPQCKLHFNNQQVVNLHDSVHVGDIINNDISLILERFNQMLEEKKLIITSDEITDADEAKYEQIILTSKKEISNLKDLKSKISALRLLSKAANNARFINKSLELDFEIANLQIDSDDPIHKINGHMGLSEYYGSYERRHSPGAKNIYHARRALELCEIYISPKKGGYTPLHFEIKFQLAKELISFNETPQNEIHNLLMRMEIEEPTDLSVLNLALDYYFKTMQYSKYRKTSRKMRKMLDEFGEPEYYMRLPDRGLEYGSYILTLLLSKLFWTIVLLIIVGFVII
jgi:hypothetical protein